MENIAADASETIADNVEKLRAASCQLMIVECDRESLCDWIMQFYQFIASLSYEKFTQDPVGYAGSLGDLLERLPQ